MIVFRALFHYGIAVAYLWIPNELDLYYGILVITYLFLYSIAVTKYRPFVDVHTFLLGYGATWCAQLLTLGVHKSIGITAVLAIYMMLITKEKKKEGKIEKDQKELVKSFVYAVFIPFSTIMCLLYWFGFETCNFLIYYACLYYGIYRVKEVMKYALYFIPITLCNTLLIVYAYYYLPFSNVEKGLLYILFVLSIEYTRKTSKKGGASYSIRI